MGLALLIGFLTQVAALVGMCITLLLLYARKRYSVIAEESAACYVLIIAMCLSLLLSGAGAIAIDIPL